MSSSEKKVKSKRPKKKKAIKLPKDLPRFWRDSPTKNRQRPTDIAN
jgi:hypothetical protein